MKEQTMPAVFPSTYLTDYAQRKTAENKDLTQYLVNFLHEADFNITNISSDIVNRQISDEEVKFRISDESIPKDERADNACSFPHNLSYRLCTAENS
jgi:hypothetical protein